MSNPNLADRFIAGTAGLSAKTVAGIRRNTIDGAALRRLGRDGRVRPLSTAEGRLMAGQALTDRPNSSLREIARETGLSVGTVRDVRARLRSGQDPVPPGKRVARQETAVEPRRPDPAPETVDAPSVLSGLRNDPSLRYHEPGRELLRWLGSRAVTLVQWHRTSRDVPPHCVVPLASVARECARVWNEIAEDLDRKGGEYV